MIVQVDKTLFQGCSFTFAFFKYSEIIKKEEEIEKEKKTFMNLKSRRKNNISNREQKKRERHELLDL